MPNPSTNYLRLHTEDNDPEFGLSLDLPAWPHLQAAYEGLTGWQLKCQTDSLPAQGESICNIPGLFGDQPGRLFRQRSNAAPPLELSDEHARELAQAIAGLLAELQATRITLEQRNAELATAVPVIARGEASSDFNSRLQAILRGTTAGLGGRAAALYLLDDATSQLQLRSHWGLPLRSLREPARALATAIADLEALTGHAVVIEDAQLLSHWGIPEECRSAVCVPVSSPDTILGTLWLFADRVRDYSTAETELLEIVAGRLAAELERRVLLQAAAEQVRQRKVFEQATAWHRDRAAQTPPLLDGWQVAAALVEDGASCGDFSTWRLAAEDRFVFAAASVDTLARDRMLSATLLQGALQATIRQSLAPAAALQTINDVLWAGHPGAEPTSVFLGELDPFRGVFDYATAGETDAYILRPHGWEPIVEKVDPLGIEADWRSDGLQQDIHPGDVLIVFSDRRLDRSQGANPSEATALAETLLTHIHLSASELAELAVRQIGSRCADPWARSMLVIKRCES